MAIRALDGREKARLSKAIHLLTMAPGPHSVFQGVPVLRHAYASLVVFVDEECPTSYTDCRFRVGIGPKWLDEQETELETLAFLILHETLHNTQRHRQRLFDLAEHDLANIAGDLEINELACTGCLGLDVEAGPGNGQDAWRLVPGYHEDDNGTPVIDGVIPHVGAYRKHPVRATAERHLQLLQDERRQQGSGTGQSNAGQSNAGQSDAAQGEGAQGDDARQDAAQHGKQASQGSRQQETGRPWDDCGVDDMDPRWTAAEQAGARPVPVAQEARIREQIAHDVREALETRSYGSGALGELLKLTLDGLKPPKVDWRKIMQAALGHACQQAANGRSDYSYRRPNRRHAWMDGPVLPGFTGYAPRVMVALDTSASMGKREYGDALSELEGIVRSTCTRPVFCMVDAQTHGKVRPVAGARDALRGLRGGGGTDMSVPVREACAMPRNMRPDVLVIATDGYFDWDRLADALRDKRAQAMQIVVFIAGENDPGQWDREIRVARAAHRHCRIVCA